MRLAARALLGVIAASLLAIAAVTFAPQLVFGP